MMKSILFYFVAATLRRREERFIQRFLKKDTTAKNPNIIIGMISRIRKIPVNNARKLKDIKVINSHSSINVIINDQSPELCSSLYSLQPLDDGGSILFKKNQSSSS